jgi:hypothetical protein
MLAKEGTSEKMPTKSKKILAAITAFIAFSLVSCFIYSTLRTADEELGGKNETPPKVPVPRRDSSREDLFASRLQILEELSKISFADDILVSGLDANGRREISEPFVRFDRFDKTALESLDIYVNGYRLVSPDSVVVEKFLSPAGGKTEYTLSLTALWENENLAPEQRHLEYWSEGIAGPALTRGNPDGTVSLTIASENTGSILELQAVPQSGDVSVSVTGAKMLFQSGNLPDIKKISGKIRSLCGMKKAIETGEWKWRSPDGTPSNKKTIESVIDGGIVKWYGFSDWNGSPLIDGSAVAWNGILSSAQFVAAGKENSKHVLESLSVLPLDDGFSLDVEDLQSSDIVKISVTDRFVINFSSLWGM